MPGFEIKGMQDVPEGLSEGNADFLEFILKVFKKLSSFQVE